MNFSGNLSLTNENSSEETNGWNFTATTAGWRTSGRSSEREWTTYVVVTVQWIIFVVGSVGNIMVLVVLLWRRSGSQVGTQLFVGSLAVADIGLMFSTVWIEAYDEIKGIWHFGLIACKLQVMWQFMTMQCTIWTLAALSVDRFLGMSKIGGTGFRVSVAVAIIICIWINNVAVSIPMFIWGDMRIGWSGQIVCYAVGMEITYVLVIRVVNFYLPLIIAWTSYIGIILKFKRAVNKIGGQGVAGMSTVAGSSAQQQAARKVTKMCIVIATTFTVTWLPYQLIRILTDNKNIATNYDVIDALETMAYLNSCVNPVVYAFMWRPFRQSLVQMKSNLFASCSGAKLMGNISATTASSAPAREQQKTTIM